MIDDIMADRIDRPIFLLGPGRSGSTLIHELLTLHRDVACFISWSNKFPRQPWLGVGTHLRFASLERYLRTLKGYPLPTEAYGIWKCCFRDFWDACRDVCTDEDGAARLRHLIAVHLRVQRRPRFLAKLTGPPMVTFLSSIFPDARFVWLDRDPRAVCYSYMKRGWIGLGPEDRERASPDERVGLAAKRYLDFYREISSQETQCYWLRYEDFIAAPEDESCRLMDYLELRQDPKMLRRIRQWPLVKEANAQWEAALTETQKRLLEGLLEQPLRERRYI